MAISLPFLVSDNNYTLVCPIDDEAIEFDVRWNSRDEAWYLDIYEDDDTVIALNVKLVLGVSLGRKSRHPFFQSHTMIAVDTTGSGTDPGYDDLGSRVQIIVENVSSVVG